MPIGPQPRWRNGVGIALILAWIVGWSVLVVSASSLIANAPIWAHLVYYAVAGILWIVPLKPVLRWMNR